MLSRYNIQSLSDSGSPCLCDMSHILAPPYLTGMLFLLLSRLEIQASGLSIKYLLKVLTIGSQMNLNLLFVTRGTKDRFCCRFAAVVSVISGT